MTIFVTTSSHVISFMSLKAFLQTMNEEMLFSIIFSISFGNISNKKSASAAYIACQFNLQNCWILHNGDRNVWFDNNTDRGNNMANVKQYLISHEWKKMTSRTEIVQDYWLLKRISNINNSLHKFHAWIWITSISGLSDEEIITIAKEKEKEINDKFEKIKVD
ncbi:MULTISPECIES: hypothetical protein [unclassified Sporolactobacillus]|uniref:hypothetical protein n=1 Tax=unclassified Sporolactobacillus TaxID=2628533 RepID=UPI00236827FC|nr:hypothetical protein [Sporolactobacillus sp. CQH2019]MDD9150473.1 hypothetical protein [Sporolactobacillus sp. CQH2019]